MPFSKIFTILFFTNLLIFNFLDKTNCQNRYFHYRFENLKPTGMGIFSGEYKMEATPDGGFVFANKDWTTDNIFAIKIDSCGEVLWARRLAGMPTSTSCSGMVSGPSGDVAMLFQRYDLSGDDHVFAIKLDADGKILWQKRFAFNSSLAKSDFHVAADGRYCFGSVFFNGQEQYHNLIYLNPETGDIAQAYGFYGLGSAGVPFYANMPNGNLLIRKLDEWISFNPNTEKVDWTVLFSDPASGWERSKPLIFGDKIIYPSLAGPLYTTGKILLRFFDLQGKYLFSGDQFEANGLGLANSNAWVPRQMTALPDKRFAIVATQNTSEMQWALLIFDSLGRQISTRHFHPKTDVFRKAHDQVLLADGSMAVLGESDGRIEVLKISLEKTVNFCLGDTISLPPSHSQDDILPKLPIIYEVKKVQFPSINLNLTEHDFDLEIEKICDSTQMFPDRDTVFQICRNDSVLVAAAAGWSATCIWDDGFEGCERVLRPGDGSKTASIRIRCVDFFQKYTVEEKTDCPCLVNFPTAFTPNNDDVNDFFRPVSDCQFLKYEMEVFNRWGQSVFTSTNFDTSWDGRINDLEAPSDVYIFILKYQTLVAGTGEILAKGEVILLR